MANGYWGVKGGGFFNELVDTLENLERLRNVVEAPLNREREELTLRFNNLNQMVDSANTEGALDILDTAFKQLSADSSLFPELQIYSDLTIQKVKARNDDFDLYKTYMTGPLTKNLTNILYKQPIFENGEQKTDENGDLMFADGPLTEEIVMRWDPGQLQTWNSHMNNLSVVSEMGQAYGFNVGGDMQINGDIIQISGILDAALQALMNDEKITMNEARYVVRGQGDMLETARGQNLELANRNLKNLESRKDSIINSQTKLNQTLAILPIKDSIKNGETVENLTSFSPDIADNIENLINSYMLDMDDEVNELMENNPDMTSDMAKNQIRKNLETQLYGATVPALMTGWTRELISLENEIKKWNGYYNYWYGGEGYGYDPKTSLGYHPGFSLSDDEKHTQVNNILGNSETLNTSDPGMFFNSDTTELTYVMESQIMDGGRDIPVMAYVNASTNEIYTMDSIEKSLYGTKTWSDAALKDISNEKMFEKFIANDGAGMGRYVNKNYWKYLTTNIEDLKLNEELGGVSKETWNKYNEDEKSDLINKMWDLKEVARIELANINEIANKVSDGQIKKWIRGDLMVLDFVQEYMAANPGSKVLQSIKNASGNSDYDGIAEGLWIMLDWATDIERENPGTFPEIRKTNKLAYLNALEQYVKDNTSK